MIHKTKHHNPVVRSAKMNPHKVNGCQSYCNMFLNRGNNSWRSQNMCFHCSWTCPCSIAKSNQSRCREKCPMETHGTCITINPRKGSNGSQWLSLVSKILKNVLEQIRHRPMQLKVWNMSLLFWNKSMLHCTSSIHADAELQTTHSFICIRHFSSFFPPCAVQLS
jgi:hypothetical protein